MCIICENKNLDGLRTLECSYCPLLTNIPQINGLQSLDCSSCPLLTEIPQINGLQTLYCYNCPLLTNIPLINGLQTLNCSGCRSLTGLNVTSVFQSLQTSGCIWLSNDPDFNESMKKLIRLQKWFKRLYLGKKLRKLIPQLIPLYYHPDAKGGYFDKLEIIKFVRGLLQDP
jgi:hypothetical protein